jgi:phosphatidate cytidylyltransferase
MKQRIISGLCMAPFLILLYLGSYWLAAMCIFVGFVGVREFYNGFRAMDIHPSSGIAYTALFVLYFIHGMWPDSYELILAWLVAVIMVSSIYMFNVKKYHPVDAMATMVGIIYIEFFSFHVTLVDQTGPYAILVWLVVLAAFGSDIFAYFTGVFLGKHKLCPDLSPKKTIEGAVGGVIGSAVVCGLFGYFVCPYLLVHCIIIGFVGSVISMCGDLTASAYKRKMGIKDYGNLIPGHGGIMDRFDSTLFTAPFVYYYIVIVLEYFQLG